MTFNLPSPFLNPFVPAKINTGPWVGGYSLPALQQRCSVERVVLPIYSLGTSVTELAALGTLVLPPLYHEALDADLKSELITQIRRCFPWFEGTQARTSSDRSIEVVELPMHRPPAPSSPPRSLVLGVDTTVEQHGPHLPLATDTIQTYAVLQKLAAEVEGLVVGPSLDYGHLTWGLPFGMSIDITAPLLTRYCCNFVNAMVDWLNPTTLFVADVHGSMVHREAVQAGLRKSRCARWSFRWLHDPLAEFGAQRGDMHAGGVETVLVRHINPALVDESWWPSRVDELAAGQMTIAEALELSADIRHFIARVESKPGNGIVGDIRNAFRLDAADLFSRMLAVARQDMERLLSP